MTKEACQSRDCCYNEKDTPGAQDAPQCYYPANAEIDAYHQNTIIAEGMVPCILCQRPMTAALQMADSCRSLQGPPLLYK